MKRLFILFFLAASIISCQKDPMAEINDGSWNKEKQLLSIKFTDQVGDAAISINAEDMAKGDAEVVILLAKYDTPVEIKAMEISYGATASIGVGETLTFDSATKSATIDVTAQTGGTRTYTIVAKELEEELVGTWYINGMNVLGGAATKWGCGAMVDIVGSNDGSMWEATTGAVAELDNTITFTLEGLTDDGYTYGKCVNDAGADGLYADFTWLEPAGGLEFTDCNGEFRQIPTGESTWVHNTTNGTVSFTKEGVTSSGTMMYAGTHTIAGDEDSYELVVAENALEFSGFSQKTGWDDNVLWTTYGRVVCWPLKYYIQYSKTPTDIPTPDPYVPSSEAELSSITFENQIGSAVIDTDANTAAVNIYDYDFSAGLKVTALSLSDKATASIAVDDAITFDATTHTATFTITAEDGTESLYTITVVEAEAPDAFTFEGEWSVSSISLFVDFFSWEDWGSSETQLLSSFFPETSAEDDNNAIFTITSNDGGVQSGTYNLTAGEDGEYADFIYTSTSSLITDPVDMSERLRIMPLGEGTWSYTESDATMVITVDNVDYSLAVETADDGSMTLKAELAYDSAPFNWDNNTVDYNYEKLYHLSKNMWYVFTK